MPRGAQHVVCVVVQTQRVQPATLVCLVELRVSDRCTIRIGGCCLEAYRIHLCAGLARRGLLRE
jgi:hypothetical protein